VGWALSAHPDNGYWVSVSEVAEKNRIIVGRKKSLTNYKTIIEVKKLTNPILSASTENIRKYGDPQNQITIQSWHEDKSKISKSILIKLGVWSVQRFALHWTPSTGAACKTE
jgi:hypothetical protein